MVELHRFRFFSPYLVQYSFVFAFGIDWKTRRRIPPIHASTNTTALAHKLASPLALGFRGAALPERRRRLRLRSLTTSVNQPKRGREGRGESHPLAFRWRRCPGSQNGLSLKSLYLIQPVSLPYPPFADLNICPFRRNTVVRPSNASDGRGNPAVSARKPHVAAAIIGEPSTDWHPFSFYRRILSLTPLK